MDDDLQDPASTSLTRAEFYTLVWAEPLNRLALRLGTSALKLSQICEAYGIARPDQGHWLRLEMGKPVRVHPL